MQNNMDPNVMQTPQDPTDGKQKRNNKIVLIVLLVVFFLILIISACIGIYFLGRGFGKEDAVTMTTTTTTISTTTTTLSDDGDTPATDPYEGWKVYENEERGITFKYPSDWELEEADINPAYLSVSASGGGNHSITLSAFDDTYPYFCIYPDTDESLIPDDDPLGLNREFDDYVEVKNSIVSYRRGYYQFPDGTSEIIVCLKQEDGTYKSEAVAVSYEVPSITNPDKLAILDLILLSIMDM